MSTRNRIAFSVLFVLFATACGREFEPYFLVNKTRVLAMQSDFPELRPGDTATLRALISTDEEVSYKWDWCPFESAAQDYFECPLSQQELDDLLAESLPEGVPADLFQIEDFSRGTEPEVELPYPAPQPFLLGLCEGLQAALTGEDVPEELVGAIPAFNCDDGLDVTVRMVINTPDRELVSAKRLNLWLKSDQAQDINPVVVGLQIRPHDPDDRAILISAGHDWVQDTGTREWYTIPEGDVAPILVSVKYDLRPVVVPDTVQTYRKRAPDGAEEEFLEPRSEVLEYRWFTTAGTYNPRKSLFLDGSTDFEESGETVFYIPKDDLSQTGAQSNGKAFVDACPQLTNNDSSDGCPVDIWSVVRDDRFGVGYLNRQLLATGVR